MKSTTTLGIGTTACAALLASLTLADTTGTGCALDLGTPFTLPTLNRAAFTTSTLDPASFANFIVMNFGNATSFGFPRANGLSSQPWPVRAAR